MSVQYITSKFRLDSALSSDCVAVAFAFVRVRSPPARALEIRAAFRPERLAFTGHTNFSSVRPPVCSLFISGFAAAPVEPLCSKARGASPRDATFHVYLSRSHTLAAVAAQRAAFRSAPRRAAPRLCSFEFHSARCSLAFREQPEAKRQRAERFGRVTSAERQRKCSGLSGTFGSAGWQ